ncbi:hypothetical protein IHE44_0004066 [Lamprotornis superbus]|uniref:Uncharacterized protein n=1 Tax=Lamprotornis superbus TaxID=245042 RepID=A0A835TPT7_9PASS|nr:hypothetical protein IHE44_0004066 [Lamprotornis superbus]
MGLRGRARGRAGPGWAGLGWAGPPPLRFNGATPL